MEKWEQNSNWEDLPKPGVGDIVHLRRLTDVCRYTARVIVTAVGDDKVTGHIEALFDANTSAWIMAGDKKNKYVGKEVSFKRCFMQKVIKKDTHQPPAPNIQCR